MKKIHIPTLVAIAVLAWALVNITHETFGHAGFGRISGYQVNAVSTTTAYLDADWNSVVAQDGFTSLRLFLIGGVLMNFITGLASLLVLRYVRKINAHGKLFLWLFTSFSFVIVVMNLVTVPFTGGGDLAEIIRTYENQSLVRIIVLITGIIIMVPGYLLLQRSFMPVTVIRRLRFSVTLIPLVTVIVLQSLSVIGSPFASLPPEQNHLLVSVFAYFHLLLWSFVVVFIPFPEKRHSLDNLEPSRSTGWIIAGAIVAIFYIFVLGPGIGSFEGHPLLAGI